MDLRNLSNEELLNKADRIDREEKQLVTTMLHHLREIEARRLFSEFGFKSLFDFTMKRYGYSEDQAMRRISAMRLLKELPEIESKINEGSLSLSNLGKAQSFFQKEQKLGEALSTTEKLEILEGLENKSTREAEKIILSKSSFPESFIQERVRQVTPELSEMKFPADDELLKKIDKLKGLLAHSNPNISMMELMNKLCDLGLQKWDQGKQKDTRKNSKQIKNAQLTPTTATRAESDLSTEIAAPRPATPQKQCVTKSAPKSSIKEQNSKESKRRSYYSVHIRREVWRKANSQCEQCGSTRALEIDHIIPHAKGGQDTIENLRLLCRNCNQRAAIVHYGQMKMDPYVRPKVY